MNRDTNSILLNDYSFLITFYKVPNVFLFDQGLLFFLYFLILSMENPYKKNNGFYFLIVYLFFYYIWIAIYFYHFGIFKMYQTNTLIIINQVL